MGLALLTGRGWRALRESVPGHAPLERVDKVFAEFDVAAAAITAYEPDADSDDGWAATGARVLARVADHARGSMA